MFVVLVQGKQLRTCFVNAVTAQQSLGVPGVFAGNAVHQLQYVQGSQADICEVPNGSGHHIECAVRIMLRCRDIAGSAQR